MGLIELVCQILLDPEQAQALLVFTVTPGSESAERLRLLRVIGAQSFGHARHGDGIVNLRAGQRLYG